MDNAVTPGTALRQLRLVKGAGLRELAREIWRSTTHSGQSGVVPARREHALAWQGPWTRCCATTATLRPHQGCSTSR